MFWGVLISLTNWGKCGVVCFRWDCVKNSPVLRAFCEYFLLRRGESLVMRVLGIVVRTTLGFELELG